MSNNFRNLILVLVFSVFISLSSVLHAEMKEVYGNFGGLGVVLELEGDLPLIERVLDDTPAQKSGLQEGDTITHVNGESLEGVKPQDVLDMARGEPGSRVELTIMREESEMPIKIVMSREILKKPDNPYTQSNDYIRIVLILIFATIVVLFWLTSDKRKK